MNAPQRHPPLERFERSPLTNVLKDRLSNAERGTLVSYTELSTLVNCDVRTHGRAILTTAGKRLLLDDGIATEAEPNLGIRILDPTGAINFTQAVLRHQRNSARKGQQVLGTVTAADREQLPEPKRRQWETNRLLLGTLWLFTGRAARRAVEALPAGIGISVLRRQTLALFQRKAEATNHPPTIES